MKSTVLPACLLLAVCAAQKPWEFPVLAGEDFRYSFSLEFPPGWTQMSLCRVPCEQPGHMLLQVQGQRIKSGRHVLRLDWQVHVAITRVTKQDAGVYRVGLGSVLSEKHIDFQLQVNDLCDGGIRDTGREYWASPGSDLTVTCNLGLSPRNRKFLCREDCPSFLIETNFGKGSSAEYSLNYVSSGSFNVTLKNVSASSAGRYRCGVARESSPSYCREFMVRVKGSVPTKNGTPDEGHEKGSNGNEEGSSATGAASWVLPIVVGLLSGINLILLIRLIHGKTSKTNPAHYVNTNMNVTTRRGQRPPQASSEASGAPTYASLRPQTREEEYSAIQHVPGQTNREYVVVL